MVDIWGSVKETVKSMGGSAIAPVGAVWDIASSPFQDDDVSILAELQGRVKQAIDPVFNPQTIAGAPLSYVFRGMNWAYREGVDQPLATTQILQNDAFGGRLDQLVFRDPGALFDPENWQQVFDRESWANAYNEAQTRGDNSYLGLAFGSAYAEAAMGTEQYNEHQTTARVLGLGADLSAMVALDPTYLALKGAGAARAAYQMRTITQPERLNYLKLITEGGGGGRFRPSLKSRTDEYLDWINGQNSTGRPLTGPEVLHGTPELRQYASEPQLIAGLLADAAELGGTEARNAQRRIMAVAAGDLGEIGRLRNMSAETATLADTLENARKGGAIDLRALAAQPTLRTNPTFIRGLEDQLDNLNAGGSIDKFVDDFNARIGQLLETDRTMPRAPGVHTAGKRAVNRLNDTGALRAGANAHKALDNWAAERALNARSASSLFQKGVNTVPLVVVKTVGLAASPYTKAPVAISDALRQTHFTGVANLHDWGAATTQLDSMMKIAKVQPGERMEFLSRAFIAKSEPEKMRIIAEAESIGLKALARNASARAGRPINEDYITNLLLQHNTKRAASTAALRGRAYAATEQTPEMMARAGNAAKAEDAASLAGSRGWNAERQGKWRVDQINDDGTPLSLPLLDTQLGNSVPLMDMDIARKVLARDTGYLARLSEAWADDALELGRLNNLKAAGAKGLDNAIKARAASMDWAISAGQLAMRVWKFSVLFRLGYPMRVVGEEQLRIWSSIGARSFFGDNLPEAGANFIKNRGRRGAGKAELHAMRVRRAEIADELEGDIMSAHLERQADLALVEKAIAKDKAKIAALRESGADADAIKTAEGNLADNEAGRTYLLEQLGDYGPDALKREMADLDEAILGGWRGAAPEKLKVGSADVKLDEGITIPGAFGGEYGAGFRGLTSSKGSYENLVQGIEDRMHRVASGGSHRTIANYEAGHAHAWADVLNNQFRTSPVAMHFIKGGSVDDFVKWIKRPEQASLRQRVPHFAHDPEDWGERVNAMVHDYIPTDDLRQAVIAGRVKPRDLERRVPDPSMRPAVHGRAAADNIGNSIGALSIGRVANRMFRYLSEVPTDRLSRHPFFNAMYKSHARDVYSDMIKAKPGRTFSQADLDEISHTARKLAMRDLKKTLFDVSAHSHAAHVMRFVSPFFAAHQEGVARWWKIAADNPQVIRRYTQAFDMPRYLGLTIDEDGNQVKPGEPLSRDHRILIQLPEAFGGRKLTDADGYRGWSINEQAFNLILPGGLTNPGLGPLVAVPLEWAAQNYAEDSTIADIARVFNPYPPESPQSALMPASFKRLSALTYGLTGKDPAFGVGEKEFATAMGQYQQDLTVDFMLKNGREPNAQETEELLKEAGTRASVRMFHRFLWNSTSPAPAKPESKYAVVQQGWYKIQEQARTEGEDFDWAFRKFEDKWGAAYIPLIYSTSNNPAWVDANPASVAAIKHYKGLLQSVDPALQRMVIGPYAAEMIEKNATLGEYSPEARNFLRGERMQLGSSETYYSSDEPRAAFEEQQARRGWQMYGELTAALTNQAQAMGLDTYEQSPELVALKRAGVEQLRAQNVSFDREYGTFDSTKYDRYLDDMKAIASAPEFQGDASRTDIQTLQAYLQTREYITQILDQREAAGYGGADAQANQQILATYTALVGALVESNTYFEEYFYNGAIERDPLLVKVP